MTTARTVRALLAAGAVLAVAAGCTSAGPAPGRSSSAPAAPAASTTATSAGPAAPDPLSSSAVPSATGSPIRASTAPAPTAAPPTPRSTCTALTIRVIRGSAAPGYEFAALQFVNAGSTRCELYGYPTVTLLRGGAPVGRPSSPAGTAASHFTLEPGATAETRLQDFSSCQAPLSDAIRVVAPGSSIATTRPGQLRACTLRVSPLTTPE